MTRCSVPPDLRDPVDQPPRDQGVIEPGDAPARFSSGPGTSGGDAGPWAAGGPGGHSDEPPPIQGSDFPAVPGPA